VLLYPPASVVTDTINGTENHIGPSERTTQTCPAIFLATIMKGEGAISRFDKGTHMGRKGGSPSDIEYPTSTQIEVALNGIFSINP
jgi:hypothetical protein